MNKPTQKTCLFLRFVFYLWVILAGCCLPHPSWAERVSLRLMEDRLWLDSDHASLQDVLGEFSHLGVAVRLDPAIQATVHGTLEDVDVEEGLREILGPFNYVLEWRHIEGPAGPLVVLDQMDVFQTGQRDQVQLLLKSTGEIIRPQNGPAYMKEELLLALKTRISSQEFKLLLDRIGGTVIDSMHPPGIYRIRLGVNADVPTLAALLKADENVYHAEPNFVYAPVGSQNVHSGNETSFSSAAPPVKGQPAVAVLDSGLLSMEALKNQVISTLDATRPGASLEDPSGHGTQMALIASGLILPTHAEGREQSVPVIAVKAFDENGHSTGYDLLNSLRFAAEQGAGVVNMSWGSEAESTFLHDLLIQAHDRDILLVAAAGNEPTGQAIFPAAFPEVLSVGALGADGARWTQSNFGSFIDLAAPGSAQLPVGHNGPPGTYGGTSISSAYTANLLALYRSKYPEAGRTEIIKALSSSLTDLGSPGRDPYYGDGALDNAAVSRFLR